MPKDIPMDWSIDLRKLSAHRLAGLAGIRPRIVHLTDALGVRPLAALLGTDPSNLSKVLAGKRELLHGSRAEPLILNTCSRARCNSWSHKPY